MSYVRGKAHHEVSGPTQKVRIRTEAVVMCVVVMHEALLYVARHILRYISYELKSRLTAFPAQRTAGMPCVRWRTNPGCLSSCRFPTFI
ncbi:hypothetical protein CBM2637_B110304 [Cupriavidus taiwanensis]|nr:hypothetical protein CBM2637_B110304 [Cupriavidus taiwanensis]